MGQACTCDGSVPRKQDPSELVEGDLASELGQLVPLEKTGQLKAMVSVANAVFTTRSNSRLSKTSDARDAGDGMRFQCQLASYKGTESKEAGFVFDNWGCCLQLVAIAADSTGIHSYNSGAPDDKKLVPGDFLVKVNGAKTTPEMKASLRKEGPWLLMWAHPCRQVVELSKSNEKESWGFSCTYMRDHSRCLMVVHIRDGPLKRFNDGVEAPMRINPGDLIEEVNRVSGYAAHMDESIPLAQTLQLVFLRMVAADK